MACWCRLACSPLTIPGPADFAVLLPAALRVLLNLTHRYEPAIAGLVTSTPGALSSALSLAMGISTQNGGSFESRAVRHHARVIEVRGIAGRAHAGHQVFTRAPNQALCGAHKDDILMQLLGVVTNAVEEGGIGQRAVAQGGA